MNKNQNSPSHLKFRLSSLFVCALLPAFLAPSLSVAQPLPLISTPVPPASLTSMQILMPEQIFSIFESEVRLAPTDPLHRQEFLSLASQAVRDKNLDKSQYILIVDRNNKRQVASLGFFNFEKKTLDVSSFTLVATGAVKKGKFITPLGWFDHVVSNGSYRAEGSKNENGIRGYGRKGMRVWDLGWQDAQASWVKDTRIMPIRFQLHATDPDFLEPKLGTPGSQGCVRMSATLNQFLDKYGILDSNFEAVNYWALRKDRTPAQMAGSLTLVIETSPVTSITPPTPTFTGEIKV